MSDNKFITPTVVNCQTTEYDIFIGRPSKWGNPFVMGYDGCRAQVIEKYEKYFLDNDKLQQSLIELSGKRLGCFCYPQTCHGDILIKYFKQRFIYPELY